MTASRRLPLALAAVGVLCLLVLAACPAAAQPSRVRVIGVTLDEAGGELRVTIATSGPARYQQQAIRPNWVVVDVGGAELGMPAGTLPLTRGLVAKVRVGQFAPDIVRVVVELTGPAQVRVAAAPDRSAIIVGIPTAGGARTTPEPAQLPAPVFVQRVTPESAQRTPTAPIRPAAPQPAPGQAAAADSGYVLGPEDVVEVTVWGYADLTRSVPVRPDGKISVPLAGTMQASGMSVEQLTQALTRAYAIYIIDPRVTVIVKEFRKVRISVLGQVAHPGTYQLAPGSGVLDALSAAGGVTDVAALKEAQLLNPGVPPKAIDLQSALAGTPGANIRLRGGETLVVPEDTASLVSVLGEVAHPGRYRIKGEMHLLDALATAGGITEKASVTQAQLVRASHQREALNLEALLMRQDMNQNLAIQAGDTLIIPEETDNKLYVIGDVAHPGIYPLKGQVTLLQAIAMAGGPVQHGIGTSKTAYIVRHTGPSDQFMAVGTAPPSNGLVAASAQTTSVQRLADRGVLMTVDLQAMMRGDLRRDEPLRPGDVVVIPETGMSALPTIFSIISTILFGIHF